MTADLKPDEAKEEYRRIPVGVAGRGSRRPRRRRKALRALLEVALPKKKVEATSRPASGRTRRRSGQRPGSRGKWPGRRLAELVRNNPEQEARWAERAEAVAR